MILGSACQALLDRRLHLRLMRDPEQAVAALVPGPPRLTLAAPSPCLANVFVAAAAHVFIVRQGQAIIYADGMRCTFGQAQKA